MCYSDDARPPVPPSNGGSVAHASDLVLEAADGNRFAAYVARASAPTGRAMVVLPDVRGLHTFYKELAERFAEVGVDAIAIDYFGRTAGIGDRSEAFEWRPHVEQTTPEGVQADVAAAVAYLRSPEGGAARSVFTVGFCFGGAASWRQSAGGHDLAGTIGFYGMPARARDVIPKMSAPLLLLVAGADFTPLEEFQKFDQELAAAGVPHRMQVYDGAPHSFFDRSFAEHESACADAWQQIVSFLDQNAPVAAHVRG